MSEFPHLSKAPIVEAVLDFRVSQRPDFAVEALRLAAPRLPDGYRCAKIQKGYVSKVLLGPELLLQHAIQDLGITDYAFHSTDDKYIAQFRRDGFSFSRLAPLYHVGRCVREGGQFLAALRRNRRPD